MESNETAGTVNRKTAEDSLELALEAQVIPQSPGGTARRVGQKSPMAAMQKREKKVVNRLGIGRLENGEPFIHGWPVERRPPSLEGVPSQSVVEAANWIGKAMKVVQNHMDSYLVRKPVLNCKDLRLRVSSGFTGLDASGRACKIIEKNGSKCQFQMESVCDNDVDVQEGLLHDKHFENQCVFQNALDLVDHATRKKLYQAKGIDEINAVLDTATWQTHARCLRHPLQPGGCKLPAKIDLDLAGASCKDDSLQGSFKQEKGASETFLALPYEIAHAIIRTFVRHSQAFGEALKEVRRAEIEDPSFSKSKSKKARDAFNSMRVMDRHIVLNRRTAWVATPQWVSRHVVTDENGFPRAKNEHAKCWVLTLRTSIPDDGEIDLKLRPFASEEFRTVRCLDLSTGIPSTNLDGLFQAYEYLLGSGDYGDGHDHDQESVGSVGEDEFYDPADVESLPGDEDGLEGQQDVMMEKVMQDPAPVKKSSKEAEQVQFEDGDVDPNMDPVNESSGPLEEIDFVSFHGVDPMIHGSEKGSHYAPPAFFDREAFKSLAEKGLTVIPAEQGYMLSYHSKTFQWHARCVWKDANMAPTWGATRTEEQALCLAIERSWMWFVELNPNDEEGVLRLGKIREHLKKNQLMKRGAACFSTCCAGTCTVSSFH